MLTITDTAADVVRRLASGSGLQPEPGLRIAAGAPTPEGTPLELSLAPAPEATDQTIENGGASVYVQEEVVPALDDKVLDAAVEGDQVRFSVLDGPQTRDGAI